MREDHSLLWERIEEELDCKKFLSIDEKKLDFIFELLKANKNRNSTIYCGHSHESILLMIQENLKPNKKIILYNIDHHHDINYNKTQEQLAYVHNIAECGTWVTYLHSYNLIDRYYWINNQNSKKYIGKNETCPKTTILTYEKNENLVFPLFDYIYVTFSTNWFPPEFLYLIENFKKFLETNFETVIDYGWEEFNQNRQSRKLFS